MLPGRCLLPLQHQWSHTLIRRLKLSATNSLLPSGLSVASLGRFQSSGPAAGRGGLGPRCGRKLFCKRMQTQPLLPSAMRPLLGLPAEHRTRAGGACAEHRCNGAIVPEELDPVVELVLWTGSRVQRAEGWAGRHQQGVRAPALTGLLVARFKTLSQQCSHRTEQCLHGMGPMLHGVTDLGGHRHASGRWLRLTCCQQEPVWQRKNSGHAVQLAGSAGVARGPEGQHWLQAAQSRAAPASLMTARRLGTQQQHSTGARRGQAAVAAPGRRRWGGGATAEAGPCLVAALQEGAAPAAASSIKAGPSISTGRRDTTCG